MPGCLQGVLSDLAGGNIGTDRLGRSDGHPHSFHRPYVARSPYNACGCATDREGTSNAETKDR